MLRQYTVKHYSGLSSERPPTLPFGDFYFEEDTGQLYKYGSDNLAKEVSGLSLSSSGYSHTGSFASKPASAQYVW